MEKKSFKFLFLACVVFTAVFFILKLIIPFLVFNNLMGWDLAGLYFSTWYQKEYLFPSVIGWNPYFFLGYAQNQFYPPLFSYLGAALSFLMPLNWAFKSVFVFALFLMPLSFYFFARAFGFSKLKAGIAMISMTAVLFIFPNDVFGGNIHATFRIGLVTHALGIGLFFFYWGVLERYRSSKKYILAGCLLALIVLTHIIAAFAAVFLFLSYLIYRTRNKEDLGFFIKHGAIAFLLSAFWTVPFLAKLGWFEAYTIGNILNPMIFLVIAVVYGFLVFIRGEKKFTSISLFIGVLIASSFILVNVFFIPVHVYRNMMFLHLLMPFLMLSLINKESFFVYSSFFIASVVLMGILADVNPKGPENIESKKFVLDEELKKGIHEGGRVYVFASYSKESSPHLLQHQISMQNRVHSLRGLYIESAKNARYIFDLEQELEPDDSLVWGTYIDKPFISSENKVIENILPYQFNLLGVQGVVASEQFFPQWKEIGYICSYEDNESINYSYSLYKVGNSSLIEVLNYKPRVAEGNWNDKTAEWFLSEDIKEGILVDEEVPELTGSGREKVEILEKSKRSDYLRFKVESDERVPVLIKISQFPNWKAYEISGEERKELKIYRASPYIMLIYGKGEIELRYEMLFIDKLGIFLSLLGVVWLLVFLMGKFRIK